MHDNNVPEASQDMLVWVTVTHIQVTRVLQEHKGSFVVLNQWMRVSRACAPLVCSFRALVRGDYQICMIFILYLVLLHWMPLHTLFLIVFVVVVIVEKPCSETNIFISQLFIVLFSVLSDGAVHTLHVIFSLLRKVSSHISCKHRGEQYPCKWGWNFRIKTWVLQWTKYGLNDPDHIQTCIHTCLHH